MINWISTIISCNPFNGKLSADDAEKVDTIELPPKNNQQQYRRTYVYHLFHFGKKT